MLVLVGGSASGKSTIEKELSSKHGYKKIISYTTRKPRPGEENGVDYHFVSDEEFDSLKLNGYFVENTMYNGWKYGAPKNQCDDNTVFVVNPCGLRQIKKVKDINVISFYIDVPRRDRLIKILQRGDNIDESIRRSIHDDGQFTGIEDEVDFIVNNEGYHISVQELAKNIKIAYEVEIGHRLSCEKAKQKIVISKDSIPSKKTLFIDFDGTIVNSIKSVVSMYNEDYKLYPNYNRIPWQQISTWEFKELKAAKADQFKLYFGQQRFFDRVEFMPDAKKVLEKLSEKYNIAVVSIGNAANLNGKENWLKKHMPYANLIGIDIDSYEDKGHIDMSEGIFIDDRADYLESSNAKIKICYGKIYPWNKDFYSDGINKFECFNWKEIEKVLINDRL